MEQGGNPRSQWDSDTNFLPEKSVSITINTVLIFFLLNRISLSYFSGHSTSHSSYERPDVLC